MGSLRSYYKTSTTAFICIIQIILMPFSSNYIRHRPMLVEPFFLLKHLFFFGKENVKKKYQLKTKPAGLYTLYSFKPCC
jgi:hypothetical protein